MIKCFCFICCCCCCRPFLSVWVFLSLMFLWSFGSTFFAVMACGVSLKYFTGRQNERIERINTVYYWHYAAIAVQFAICKSLCASHTISFGNERVTIKSCIFIFLFLLSLSLSRFLNLSALTPHTAPCTNERDMGGCYLICELISEFMPHPIFASKNQANFGFKAAAVAALAPVTSNHSHLPNTFVRSFLHSFIFFSIILSRRVVFIYGDI